MKHLNDQQLLDYVSGRMSDEEHIRMTAHASICRDCSKRLQGLEYLRDNFDKVWDEWTAGKSGALSIVGTLWREIRRAFASEKEAVKEWGQQCMSAICSAMNPVISDVRTVPAHSVAGPDTLEFRFAKSPTREATVLSDDWQETGRTDLMVAKAPCVDEDGRFRLELGCDQNAVGKVLLCAISLPDAPRISFAKEIEETKLIIEEEGFECEKSGRISWEYVQLFVIGLDAYKQAGYHLE